MRRGSARWRDEKHSLQRGRARRRRGKLPPNHGLLTHRNHARKRARRHQLSIGHSCRTASPQLSHASCPNFKLEPSFCSAWAAERLWMLGMTGLGDPSRERNWYWRLIHFASQHGTRLQKVTALAALSVPSVTRFFLDQ